MATTNTNTNTNNIINNKRTFKIKTNEGTFNSRIMGKTPKQAALKALSKINEHSINGGSNYEILKNDDKFNVFKFTIKETTRLSPHKEYTYTGYRKELETPAVYKIRTSDGKTKEIINKYKNIVEKFKDKTV